MYISFRDVCSYQILLQVAFLPAIISNVGHYVKYCRNFLWFNSSIKNFNSDIFFQNLVWQFGDIAPMKNVAKLCDINICNINIADIYPLAKQIYRSCQSRSLSVPTSEYPRGLVRRRYVWRPLRAGVAPLVAAAARAAVRASRWRTSWSCNATQTTKLSFEG